MLALHGGGFAASASSLATGYTLNPATTGTHPQATLLRAADGTLISTAAGGGRFGFGTVFALKPAGVAGSYTATVLHNFHGGTDGAAPDQGVIADANGLLYGVTPQGGGAGCGATGCGTVFRLTPPAVPGKPWSAHMLHRFTGAADGSVPEGALTIDSAGVLYGTTSAGGAGFGTVFALVPNKAGSAYKFETLYSFQGGSDGASPLYGPLLLGPGGVLFGTTFNGGATCAGVGAGQSCGTVFSLTPPAAKGGTWTEAVLYRFTGAYDGGFPANGLTAGAAGELYGVTDKAQTIGRSLLGGTVFKLTQSVLGGWSLATIYTFAPTFMGDGATPNGGLVADGTGALFGLTVQGGTSAIPCLGVRGCGTAFRLTPPAAPATNWTETVLYRFTGNADGSMPMGGLTPDGAGNFLGTASSLLLPGSGTVFQLTP